jgi:hypothetical protein
LFLLFLSIPLQEEEWDHLNEEVTTEKVVRGRPDAVILATGLLPLIPEISGIGNENVVTAWDVLMGKGVNGLNSQGTRGIVKKSF